MTEKKHDEELETVQDSRERQEEERRDYEERGPRISVMYEPDGDTVTEHRKAPHVYCSRHWGIMKARAEELGEKINDADSMLTPLLVNDAVRLMFRESAKGMLPREIEDHLHCCQRHFAEAASAFIASKAPLCCYVANAPEGALEESGVEVSSGYIAVPRHELLDTESLRDKSTAQFPAEKPKHIC